MLTDSSLNKRLPRSKYLWRGAPKDLHAPTVIAEFQGAEVSLRTNYVLIDFENVRPEAVSLLDGEHFKIMVFIGAAQSSVPFAFAAGLQCFGSRVDYIKISGNGPNALDFHIAFYIGQLAQADPTAYFHIISKDTGFDPLVSHLRAKKIYAGRVKDISDIPSIKLARAASVDERLSLVIENLQKRTAGRPNSVKTLSNTIAALFQKRLCDAEVAALVDGLRSQGYVSIAKTKVSYALPRDG